MTIEVLEREMSVCRMASLDGRDALRPFFFAAVTDEEISLVCPTAQTPPGVEKREDGYRMMRVAGELDLSLVGILSGIAATLARAQVNIFCVSTYNTDYVLVPATKLSRAVQALRQAGYTMTEEKRG